MSTPWGTPTLSWPPCNPQLQTETPPPQGVGPGGSGTPKRWCPLHVPMPAPPVSPVPPPWTFPPHWAMPTDALAKINVFPSCLCSLHPVLGDLKGCPQDGTPWGWGDTAVGSPGVSGGPCCPPRPHLGCKVGGAGEEGEAPRSPQSTHPRVPLTPTRCAGRGVLGSQPRAHPHSNDPQHPNDPTDTPSTSTLSCLCPQHPKDPTVPGTSL